MRIPQTEHLDTLIALLDEGSFDAAARRLRITPSAVSQRVKAMEGAAGAVLVERSSPVAATAAGAAVLRFARQVALLAAELERELGGDGASPVLAVAVNSDSLATWFLPALARAQVEFGTMFDVHREDQSRTAELLRSGAVLAAVTAERSAVQGCRSDPLGTMRYRAVATPQLRERWMPTGRPRDLDTAPLVDYDRTDDLQQGFLRRVLGHPPRSPRHFVPTSADFQRAVLLGMGWGLLPDLQSNEHLASGRLVELAPDRPVDVALYWQRWNLRSTTLDTLTAIVLEAAADALTPLR